VVVTGTRRAGVDPAETLSPVDVISGDLIANQASFDLTDSLTALTPSLNTQRFPIADGTALIRPVTLRNLSPDHTLVLLDGKRRHRSVRPIRALRASIGRRFLPQRSSASKYCATVPPPSTARMQSPAS